MATKLEVGGYVGVSGEPSRPKASSLAGAGELDIVATVSRQPKKGDEVVAGM